MRTTIAYKKHSAGIVYIILTFVGVMLLISAIAEKLIPMGIIGGLLTVVSAVLSIRFLKSIVEKYELEYAIRLFE